MSVGSEKRPQTNIWCTCVDMVEISHVWGVFVLTRLRFPMYGVCTCVDTVEISHVWGVLVLTGLRFPKYGMYLC